MIIDADDAKGFEWWYQRVMLDVEMVDTWLIERPANGSGVGVWVLGDDGRVKRFSLPSDEVDGLIADLRSASET